MPAKKTFVEEQFAPVHIPRVYEIYNKNPAQKIIDKTLNLNMYQDSLGTNEIKYKKKRNEGDNERADLSDSGDFPDRNEFPFDVKDPFR